VSVVVPMANCCLNLFETEAGDNQAEEVANSVANVACLRLRFMIPILMWENSIEGKNPDLLILVAVLAETLIIRRMDICVGCGTFLQIIGVINN